jgi:hypothetical protein
MGALALLARRAGLACQLLQPSFAYFRHSNTPLAIHVGAVAGPLAWNFAALHWAGAAAVRATHLVARIAAHLSICSWLAYGVFYLVTYKDYVVGFALSLLSACTCPSRCKMRVPASDRTQR